MFQALKLTVKTTADYLVLFLEIFRGSLNSKYHICKLRSTLHTAEAGKFSKRVNTFPFTSQIQNISNITMLTVLNSRQ